MTLDLQDAENRIAVLETKLQQRKNALAEAKVRRDVIQQNLETLQEVVESARTSADEYLAARKLFENLTDQKRELVREKIEALVTHGIQSVFGEEYSFRIEQKLSRNQVTFEYRIVQHLRGDTVETELRGAHGGGLVGLVGFLLRLVMVLFSHPPRRRILFLDETFANLGPDKRPYLARLLQSLGQSLQCQFVMVTHSPEYVDEADRAYEIQRKDSASVFVPVS